MGSKRVLVSMSGGVDSSVTAYLLKEKGYEAIGVTLQIWPKSKDIGGCCGTEAILDAKKVAAKLNIPHYVINFRDIFEKKVISNFCREYSRGRTPNPCIRCNQYIKFDALLKKAKELSARFIATGHYAKIEKKDGRFFLKKGLDSKKDQSYLLYMLNQEKLKYILMPLGDFKKGEIREIARGLNLPVASKLESQEICFIPDNDYRKFLRHRLSQIFKTQISAEGGFASGESTDIKPGPIIDLKGNVLGEHQGIINYTIGQREKVAIKAKGPFYVIEIKRQENTIVVGRREDCLVDELIVDEVNFVNPEGLKFPLEVTAKVRYLHPEAKATITAFGKKIEVKFKEPQFAIAPGQAAVFYKDDEVIGGGIIEKENNV